MSKRILTENEMYFEYASRMTNAASPSKPMPFKRWKAERLKAFPPQPFTIDEVFLWICQARGVKNPDYLSDARYRSLRYAAEQATAKLNALFAIMPVEA